MSKDKSPNEKEIKNFIRENYQSGDAFTCQDIYISNLEPKDGILYNALSQMCFAQELIRIQDGWGYYANFPTHSCMVYAVV